MSIDGLKNTSSKPILNKNTISYSWMLIPSLGLDGVLLLIRNDASYEQQQYEKEHKFKLNSTTG